MRLVVWRTYRAFPELDRFSDAECEGFVRLVRRKHRLAGAAVSVTLATLAVAVFLLGMVLTLVVFDAVRYSATGSGPWEGRWALVLGIIVSVAGPVWFMSLCHGAWLRGKIGEYLATLECAACEYSLLGLQDHGGVIVCPECGQPFDLAARGMISVDVMARSQTPAAS